MTWLCPMSSLNRYKLKRSFLIYRAAWFFWGMYGICNQPFIYTSILHFIFKCESFTAGLNLKGLCQAKWSCDSLLKSQKLPKQLTSFITFHTLFIPGRFPHVHSYPNSSVMPFHHIPAAGSELKIIKKSITREVKSKAVCWLPWMTEILCRSP